MEETKCQMLSSECRVSELGRDDFHPALRDPKLDPDPLARPTRWNGEPCDAAWLPRCVHLRSFVPRGSFGRGPALRDVPTGCGGSKLMGVTNLNQDLTECGVRSAEILQKRLLTTNVGRSRLTTVIVGTFVNQTLGGSVSPFVPTWLRKRRSRMTNWMN
jgi:hypothetical protein